MELREFIALLRRWAWLIIVGMVLAACSTRGIVPTAVLTTAVIVAPTDAPTPSIQSVSNLPTPIPPVFEIEPQGRALQATLKVDSGRVELLRSGDSAYSTVGQSVLVGGGDIIRTGPTGNATLVFMDNTETILFPDTVLVLDSFVNTGGGSRAINAIQLIGQTFNRSNFATSNSQYNIATPYGVASVRGTSFWVAVVITGTLANTLLGQELESFIFQAGLNVTVGNFDALVATMMQLLSVTPGTVDVDTATGIVTFVDNGGRIVTVEAGLSAHSGTANGGAIITVTVQTLDRFCGDSVCDAYLGETTSTCSADCGG